MNNVTKISTSKLPTVYGDFLIQVYKDNTTATEHVVLTMGDVHLQENVLTRVHSECLSGDVLSSLRCDCGEQLKLAQEMIAKEGNGAIIYLRDHEGRGIGLSNKIKAYALQDEGLDTVEANIALGFPVDSRSFDIAAEILLDLNIKSIRLMSNNPSKCEALKINGTLVNRLVPLKISSNISNKKYLHTKKYKLGHLLNE
jgi:GTP cyclohydrolase II